MTSPALTSDAMLLTGYFQVNPTTSRRTLTDAGQVYGIVRGFDAVVHAGAIPEPTHNPPHVVFENNIMGTFNMVEASVRAGVKVFVNISSQTVPASFPRTSGSP